MASYNQFNQGSNNTNFAYTNSAVENKGLFNRILRGLSSYGMNYDDMIVRNQVGIGINEDPYAARGNSMYDFFSQRAVASVLNRKSIPYLDKAYGDKRRILREYSIKDEIRDFVSSLADESIVYNDERDFCSPKPLGNDYSQEVKDKYQEYFEKIYNKFGFSDSITAWNMMKDFLIDGYLALEIIYDDKKKNIIGFNRLRPETIVPAYEPTIGHLWIQFPEDPQLRRIFLDSQIVYISYSSQNDYSETSYVEGLIKPYNQLKILEQTRVMFNIINATIYQKFTIPIKGLSRQRAEEQIGQLINDYSEEVEWDDSLGTLTINGSKHLPYNKQIWFPEGDAGTPAMELVSPEGHNLNEADMLTWFYNALKRASKIPFQRFDKENGGGNLISDSADMTRDEIKFYNFINRLRANFKELIVKPLKLQMLIEFPELKEDEIVMNQIDISFNSNQVFEEWKKLNNLSKKAEIFGTLVAIMNGEKPYFHIEYLIDNVFKLTPEEKAENQKYWAKDAASVAAAAGAAPGAEGAAPAEGGDVPAEGGEAPAEGGEAAPEAQAAPETPPAEGGAEGGGGEFEF